MAIANIKEFIDMGQHMCFINDIDRGRGTELHPRCQYMKYKGCSVQVNKSCCIKYSKKRCLVCKTNVPSMLQYDVYSYVYIINVYNIKKSFDVLKLNCRAAQTMNAISMHNKLPKFSRHARAFIAMPR